MPKSVIDLILPTIISPISWLSINLVQGFGWHCFIPSDILLLSGSISKIITSIS